jgi:hypothetical protein
MKCPLCNLPRRGESNQTALQQLKNVFRWKWLHKLLCQDCRGFLAWY